MPQQYELFVEKFKRKKTSDDCYTPELVYNAVRDWVAKEYNLDTGKFVRPFWPDGDYENFDYAKDCVVVDNPPFSILSKIMRFYHSREIKFFLFAPTKTGFSHGGKPFVCCIPLDVGIVFDNGANLPISFLTNLEDTAVRTAPTLYRAILAANEANQARQKNPIPYDYPPEVITATRFARLNQGDIDFRIPRSEAYFIASIDSQKNSGKKIYGYGFLISAKKARERVEAEILTAQRIAVATAEKARQRREAAISWPLSDREIEIVKSLGTKEKEA